MKEDNPEILKHILQRFIILLLLFVLYTPIAFLAVLYLLIETFYLFKKNNKTLAIANLAILGFFAFVILILFVLFKGSKS